MRRGNPDKIKKHKWKKGQTGNPKGRPKKLPMLDKLLPEILGNENMEASEMYRILKALVKRAKLKGGDRAAEILMERAYGKAKQVVDVDVTTKGQSIREEIDYNKLSDATLREIAAAARPAEEEPTI